MTALAEQDLYAHRIAKLEEDVKHLYSKTNGFAITSAEMNAKLDNVLVTLGELEECIKAVRERAVRLWDKLIFAILAAVDTGIGTAILYAVR